MAITKLQPNAIPSGTDFTIQLTDGSVVTADIADSGVTTAKIADANVTHAKLHTDMDLSGKTVVLPTITSNVNIDVADLFVKDTTGGAQGQVQIGAGTVQGFINIQKGDGTRTVQIASDGDTYFTGGNVGIGTTSPNKTLTIATPQTANTIMEVLRLTGSGAYSSPGSNEAGAGLSFGQYSSTYPDWNLGQISGVRSGSSWGGALTFSTNNNSGEDNITERMRITTDGFVGIGTTDPGAALQIVGNTAASQSIRIDANSNNPTQINLLNGYGARQGFIFNNNGSSGYVSFGMISENTALTFKTAAYNVSTTSDLTTDWTERMRIASNGNVGIGTDSPAGKLHVNHTGSTSIFEHDTGWSDIKVAGGNGGSTPTNHLLIRNYGNPQSSTIFDNVGGGGFRFSEDNSAKVTINSGGTITVHNGYFISQKSGTIGMNNVTVSKHWGVSPSSSAFITIDLNAEVGASTGSYGSWRVRVGGYGSAGSNGVNMEYTVGGYTGHSYSSQNYNSIGAGTVGSGSISGNTYDAGNVHGYHPLKLNGAYMANGEIFVYFPSAQVLGVYIKNYHASYSITGVMTIEYTQY